MSLDVDHEETVGCIVGAVVQLKKHDCATKAQLLTYQGVDIHGEDMQSRLVITLEADDHRAMNALTESLQQLEGVLHLMPVYQYNEEQPNRGQQRGWQWR